VVWIALEEGGFNLDFALEFVARAQNTGKSVALQIEAQHRNGEI
jgi:hypothetical protein